MKYTILKLFLYLCIMDMMTSAHLIWVSDASYNRLGRCPVFYGRMVPPVFRRDSCLTTAHCPLGMTCCVTLTGRQCLYARSL
ncbi:hypothetical protein T11_9159 [Trichinella zimbabwensis]|uniref:WAP domain-containing protein n=2 Tax=Trichinella TaxID=6333 RepID=A0A0V1M8F0_9BILA|nr:hypothetical protein T11_9159 [Trichinella zimbabwensis]KRZ67900.1 hypothetical protein T10_7147 [Trichinella papuae]